MPAIIVVPGSAFSSRNIPALLARCDVYQFAGQTLFQRGATLVTMPSTANLYDGGRYPDLVVHRILDALGNEDTVGINLDTGNFYTDDPYADLAKCAPYAVNVQVKVDIKRRNDKETSPADFNRLVKILRDANYQGWVALEYEAKEDPWTAVPRLLAALAAQGLEPAAVDWLIVTHVHLDHAGGAPYSTVTDLARLRGWSTSVPRATAIS